MENNAVADQTFGTLHHALGVLEAKKIELADHAYEDLVSGATGSTMQRTLRESLETWIDRKGPGHKPSASGGQEDR